MVIPAHIYTLTQLQRDISLDPTFWRPMVFTNGCFDLIHAGHVRYLQAAKALGRSLVVGLNSVPELQRAEVLAALKAVDGVVIFQETTAEALIAALQPDIYVKGGDYTLETLPEASIVQSYGGEVAFIDIEIPSSTTAIIQRILNGSEKLESCP